MQNLEIFFMVINMNKMIKKQKWEIWTSYIVY